MIMRTFRNNIFVQYEKIRYRYVPTYILNIHISRCSVI